VILFRDGGQQFKSLYTYDPEREEVLKIHGVGPKQLTDDMMERFYKYALHNIDVMHFDLI